MRELTTQKGIVKLGHNKYEVRVPKGYNPVRKRHEQKQVIFNGKFGEAKTFQAKLAGKVKKRARNGAGWDMDQLMERYFEHVSLEHSYNGLRTEKGRWKIMSEGLGSRPVEDVDELEIDDLLGHLQRIRGIKPQTINRYRSLLSSAFKTAVRWRLIDKNPIRDVPTRTPEPYDKNLPPFEWIEFLIAAYENRLNPQMGVFLQLSWLNAMRRAEVCALQVRNFIPEEKKLLVDRVVVIKSKEDGGGWSLSWRKNRRTKTVWPLDDFSMELLSSLAGNRSNPDDFLFSDDGGKTPWRPDRVTQSQGRIRSALCRQCGTVGVGKAKRCEKCDIELGLYFRVHDLRGFLTTFLIAKGHSKAAQSRGGWHDEVAMRRHYYSETPFEMQEATDAINELFASRPS